jgi:hypothetical protein
VQRVEHRPRVADQRVAIRGRLHAFWHAVERPHAEHGLEPGDHLRDDGARHGEPVRRLGHRPFLGNDHQHVKVTRLQAAADAV